MLARLRLSFSHLREHRFRHGFKDIEYTFCPIVLKLKPQHTISCTATDSNRAIIMNDLENIPNSFSTVSDSYLISLLLYGNDQFNDRIEKY